MKSCGSRLLALNITKPLLVGAYYKPSENDGTSVLELARSLDAIRGNFKVTQLGYLEISTCPTLTGLQLARYKW